MMKTFEYIAQIGKTPEASMNDAKVCVTLFCNVLVILPDGLMRFSGSAGEVLVIYPLCIGDILTRC